MSYEPQRFAAPKYTKSEIWREADSFREKYSKDIIPVDILNIVEFDLHINIQPVKSLRQTGDVEAILLGTNDTILVDEDEFLDDRFVNRMRFSIAHEVGHLILHSNVCSKFRPSSYEEWLKYIELMNDREYIEIEQQAYEFAGRLLVPKGMLDQKYQNAIVTLNGHGLTKDDFEESVLKQYVAANICKDFGVSETVIKKRLYIEKI